MAGTFKSYAVVCDCEKKAGLDVKTPVKYPLTPTHTHIHPDDLFPNVQTILVNFSLNTLSAEKWPAVHTGEYGNWSGEILRPPPPFHTQS